MQSHLSFTYVEFPKKIDSLPPLFLIGTRMSCMYPLPGVTFRFSYYPLLSTEAVVQKCSVKKEFLEISQNSQENTCARISFLIRPEDFIKKETLAQVFSCGFCEVSENTSGGCFCIHSLNKNINFNCSIKSDPYPILLFPILTFFLVHNSCGLSSPCWDTHVTHTCKFVAKTFIL